MEEKYSDEQRHCEREKVNIPALCHLLLSGLENFPRKFATYIKDISPNGGRIELPMFWQCTNCAHCLTSSTERKCKLKSCIYNWKNVFTKEKTTLLLQLEGNIFEPDRLIKMFAKIVWVNDNKESLGVKKKYELGFYFIKRPQKLLV